MTEVEVVVWEALMYFFAAMLRWDLHPSQEAESQCSSVCTRLIDT